MLGLIKNDGLKFEQDGNTFFVLIPQESRYKYEDKYILQRAEIHFGIKFTTITHPPIKFIKSYKQDTSICRSYASLAPITLRPVSEWMMQQERMLQRLRTS